MCFLFILVVPTFSLRYIILVVPTFSLRYSKEVLDLSMCVCMNVCVCVCVCVCVYVGAWLLVPKKIHINHLSVKKELVSMQ